MQALLEEFGKWIKAGTSATQSERDAFYQAVYQEVYNVSHFFEFLEASSCHSCSGLMLSCQIIEPLPGEGFQSEQSTRHLPSDSLTRLRWNDILLCEQCRARRVAGRSRGRHSGSGLRRGRWPQRPRAAARGCTASSRATAPGPSSSRTPRP